MSPRHRTCQLAFKVPTIAKILSIVLSLQVVCDGYFNVARLKPTKQIDTFKTGPTGSELAIDGHTNMAVHGCTHTSATENSWWMIDFLRDYVILSVNITNRPTNPERLANFTVQVSMNNPLKYPGFPNRLPGEKCFYRGPFISGTVSEVINCSKPITGRYLTVFKAANAQLAICELEIFAINSPDKGSEFHSLPQKKLSLTPLALFRKVRSVLECTSLCLHINNGTSTAVQFKKNVGTCECIQFSDLTASQSVFEDNSEWLLYMSKSN